MSRQERTARRGREATAQAEKVISQAVTKVRCRECGGRGTRTDGVSTIDHEGTCSKAPKVTRAPRQRRAPEAPQKAATPTKARGGTPVPEKTASSPSDDLATECKRLRDEFNLSWMAIGAKLGLPGSKSGAANARKLYAQANGGTRPAGTVRGTGATRTRKGAGKPKHVANTGSKRDRLALLETRGHVIPEDMPDEELLAMVAGNFIEWSINVSRLGGNDDGDETVWLEQEARVHPTDLYIEEDLDKYGSRVLRFREYLGLDQEGKRMAGPTRSVRVNSIHTVR